MRGTATLVKVTKKFWTWAIVDDFETPITTEKHPAGGVPEDCKLEYNGLAAEPAEVLQ